MDREFKEFAQEVILQVFRILNAQIGNFKEKGDISAWEILERDVVPKYERLYEAFNDPEMEKSASDNEVVKKALEDIMNSYALTEEFIRDQMRRRKDLGEESGAAVVKNLFSYELKELENSKAHLLEKANEILDEEASLEHEMREAVQEEAQMEIIEKLSPVRTKYREVSEKIMKLQEKIDSVRSRLNKRWTYEIYGTVPKEEMMEIYKKVW